MFEDGDTIVVEGEGGGEDVAATDAARAEASAQAASEAAQQALVMADVSAAQVEQNAAERTADFEARLNECQELARIATQSQTDLQGEVGQLRTEMGTTREALELILSRLPPEQPQENPASGQSAQEEPGGEPAAAQDPPAEPEPPAAKRRAHRWI
jgi:hypothetical protein